MNMGRKLITTVLTIICFTLAASLISMNESYSFDFYILIYLVYATPLILLIGLPLSILLDYLLSRIQFPNHVLYLSTRILGYACAGVLGMYIYYLVMGVGEAIWDFKETLVLTLFGVLAAILFVLIDMGLEVLLKVRRRKS
ncbi:putative membrane protein [Paenibacillus sp. DS2363]